MCKPVHQMNLDEKARWVAETAMAGLIDEGTKGLRSQAYGITQTLLVDGRNRGVEDCAAFLEGQANGDPKLLKLADAMRNKQS